MYRTTDIRDRGFAAQRNRQMMNQRVRHLQDEIVETTQIEQTVFSSKVMQNMVNITKTEQDIDEDQGRAIDLCGYWMGNYGDNGYEIIQIKFIDKKFVGVKVTGDRNVPGGEVSFYVDSPPFVSVGKSVTGFIQVAHIGFMRPRFTEGELCLVSPNTFIFQWSTVRRRFERFNPHSHNLQHFSMHNYSLSLPTRTNLSSAPVFTSPQMPNHYNLDDDDEILFSQ